MKAALYYRVSTDKQSTDMQSAELREYAQRRGWDIVEYSDIASGSRSDRAGLLQLMADARKHKFRAIIVFRFDRFARSLKQLITALDEFRERDIDFISLHDGVDTSTTTGRLIFGIIASLAEFEKEVIRDRVRSGIANAKRKGVRLGRPMQHRHKQDRAIELRDSGMRPGDIAKTLKMSRRTLGRLLASPDETVRPRALALSSAPPDSGDADRDGPL